MPHRVVIALGSNKGCREFYLALSVRLIEWEIGSVVRSSSVIETPSWGFEAPLFLNQVIVVDTELSPLQLLDTLQSIERRLGRTQKSEVMDGKPVYHDRTIDLEATTDLLHPVWISPPPDSAAITVPLFYRARITLP